MENKKEDEELVNDLVTLINDFYDDLLGKLPSFISKKILIPSKVKNYAERIMNISRKYVTAIVANHK